MHIPADVIMQSAGGDRWVLYNVFTHNTVALDSHGIRALGALLDSASGAADSDSFRVWDIEVFSNYRGLFADPTRRVHSPDQWGEPQQLSGEQLRALLQAKRILIESTAEYEKYLAPKASLLDRKHAGNFHQQLGQHLLLERREDPERWWLAQKFTSDRRALGDNMYRAVQEPFIRQLIASRFKPGTRVVDLGCGTGYYTNQMASEGAEVLGVDPNDEFLKHARASAPANVEYRLAAIGAPGALDWIAPQSIDFAFMSDALLFYFVSPDPSQQPDIGELLSSIRRILKPTGSFMSVEPHGVFFLRPWLGEQDRPFTVVTEHRNRRYNVAPNVADAVATFVRAGFRIADYQELYPASADTTSDVRGVRFASTFPLWSYYELVL